MSRRKTLKATAIATFLMLFGGVAYAQLNQWSTQIKGPDVFGETTVIASIEDDLEQVLVIQCSSSEPIKLAILSEVPQDEMNKLSELGGSIPIDLLVKVDSGAVQKFEAQIMQWNNKYMGTVFTGRTPEIVALIRSIGNAKHTINVGAEKDGNRAGSPATFGVIGSASAVNTVIKNCNLDQIKDNDTLDSK
jgi:hypothetical protein